ncbi:transcriptional regulator [Candidatus Micrarchaeota archaeon]|nr:transcriptional regulator [Candidatus Micrarchaeota archaeon]
MKESISLTWRRIPERYKMYGSKCQTCSSTYFPPRSLCPKCRRKGKMEPFEFSGNGKVYSFTEIHAPPSGFEEQVPYVIAVVELDEGSRCTGQIVDAEGKDVKIGDHVEGVFRKILSDDPEGPIHYGFKFRLKK